MLQTLCEHGCLRGASGKLFLRRVGRGNLKSARTPGPTPLAVRKSITWQSCRAATANSVSPPYVKQPGRQFVPVGFVRAKDLPKCFDPKASEEDIYQWWERNKFFKPAIAAKGEPFVVPMPPANVTGKLHMGHAMFVTLQDIMTRFARMRGRDTLWLPGTDHAGIATQMVVERTLETEGLSRENLGRDGFVKKVWEWKREYGGHITCQLRRLGASCDWTREAFTLDDDLSSAVTEAFVRLHERGLIYKGNYMVNWAPQLQTAVSDLEVEYSEEQGTLYFFKYPIHDSAEFVPVATTRPETILGDTAVAVHPEDPRYKHLIGKQCVVPLTGRLIDIVGDDYVDREFGTGALKITPGHDPNDYEIGKRLNLDTINIMNKDATMNQNAGKYAGLDRYEARKALWADMKENGLVIKQEPYTMRVPRSQRGGEVIEPLVSEQWFVKMEGLAKPALDAVADGSVKILPERYEKIFNRWLTDIKDWCISRQLWWGHRIPVWYVTNLGTDSPYIVARNEIEAQNIAVAKYGSGVKLKQEEDVLDTWFSSGLWPFSTLGWPDESEPDFARYYPTQMLETAHDILFFWVARMVMMGIELTGKPPFSTVYLHGLVRDENGKKMSKSVGNVVDPLQVMGDVGTDALRFGLVTGTAPGQDLNLSMERVMSARSFSNKVWNIGKFIGANLPQDEAALAEMASSKLDYSSLNTMEELSLSERWILSRLHETIDEVTILQEHYDIGEAGRRLYEFIWGDFADWFVEAAKSRLYGVDESNKTQCLSVLVYCYRKILQLLHPYMPFVTEELWQAFPHEGLSIMVSSWPSVEARKDTSALVNFSALRSVVKSIRNIRAEYKVDIGKKIVAHITVTNAEVRSALQGEQDVIVLLARLDEEQVQIDGRADEVSSVKCVTCVVSDGIEVSLPMSGLFDASKEIDRLEKQKAKIMTELDSLQLRLGNEKFVLKAPKQVVDEVRNQKSELDQQLLQIEDRLLLMKT